jgi:hypothetical protein
LSCFRASASILLKFFWKLNIRKWLKRLDLSPNASWTLQHDHYHIFHHKKCTHTCPTLHPFENTDATNTVQAL